MKSIQTIKESSLYQKARRYRWVLVGLVFSLAIITGGTFLYRASITHMQDQQTIAALTDTITIVRNENGSQTATITAFKSARSKDLLKIKSKDSTVRWLQNVVGRYGTQIDRGGGTAVFTANTSANIKAPTTIVRGKDTVVRNDTVYLYPQYASKFNLGKWVSGTTLSTKDTTYIKLNTYNEYEVILGEKGNIFKGYVPTATINTMSPYDSIRTMSALIKSFPTPKKWGIGIIGGYGMSLAAKPTLGGFLGIGVSYNFIRF